MIVRSCATRLVCALCFCCPVTSSYADLASAIAACDAAITSSEDTAFDLFADDCPGLTEEIEGSSWEAALPPGWRTDHSYWEIARVAFFESYYRQSVPRNDDISLSTLDPIVAGLGSDVQEADKETIWDRFINWLRTLLPEESAENPGWLSKWLSKVRLPTSAIEFIFWMLTAGIIVAAIVVVVMEFKAVRKPMAENTGKGKENHHAYRVLAADRLLTAKDVEEAAPGEKLSILLRLLLQRLEKLGVIVRKPSRTHREACDVFGELDNTGVDVIGRVAKSAERIRFGGIETQTLEIKQTISDGITFIDQLDSEPV